MLDKEIWKDIEGYEGLYQVSNLGRVKSVKKRKTGERKEIILKPALTKGYEQIGLYKSGKEKNIKIHRLVAKAFILNPENKPQVNHIDGNKQNNHVDNLEWVTNRENQRHACETGLRSPLSASGIKHGQAKFSQSEVDEIRKKYIKRDKRYGIMGLAKQYNVHYHTIAGIVNYKRYK